MKTSWNIHVLHHIGAKTRYNHHLHKQLTVIKTLLVTHGPSLS